ncbi:MAG: LamG domain-containing protein [Luteolibacter sp.]
MLYPEARISERSYTPGKVYSQKPLTDLRRAQGNLAVSELTQSVVEADLDLNVIEGFLNSDAEFLPIPTGAAATALARIERVYDRGEHTVTLTGSLAEQDISEVVIVIHDGQIYGSINLPQQGRVVEYSAAGNGRVAIRELDLQKDVYGSCSLCSHSDPAGNAGPAHSCGKASAAGVMGDGTAADQVSAPAAMAAPAPAASDYVVDFVVTYSAAARDALGGVAAAEAKVILSVDAITTAMKNSLINDYHMALVATAVETEITIENWTAVNVLLEDRKTNADATYAYASELRDLTGADIAVYMYSGSSGSAGEINSFEFSIGSLSIGTPGSNFTHEFGHCCGGLHAWGDTEAYAYPYTGWRFSLAGQGYRTIMAYASPTSIYANGGARVGYFSNPNQTLKITDATGNITAQAALGAPRGFDARNDPYADPSLVRGGRTATFDANRNYVSGGYNQSGFDGTQAELGALNQEVVNATRASRAAFRNRTAGAMLSSPVGTFAGGETLSFFVYTGSHEETQQMSLYRNGVFVRTIDAAAPAHAHTLTWRIPDEGLASGAGYQVYFTSPGGTTFQSNSFTIITREVKLLADWTLDDGYGVTVKDQSGNQHDGTLASGTWTGLGRLNGALAFNGGSNSVSLPASAFSTLSSEISLAMWTYGDTAQPVNHAVFYGIDAQSNVQLRIHLPQTDGKVVWDAGYAGGVTDRAVYQTATAYEYKDRWNHWVFTKNSVTGEMSIYLNGALVRNITGATRPLGNVSTITLGSLGGMTAYRGVIDEVKLYNHSLKAGEVLDLYRSYQARPGLKAYWPLNEDSGTVVQDVSGGGHHATLVSGTRVAGGISGRAIDINAGTNHITLSASTFATVTHQVTLTLWVYGDTTQPRQNTIFHTRNASNQSIFNIHLPWSNGAVFWDAGYQGAVLDRVFYSAPSSSYKGQWNHWAFTKNTTSGSMKIYLNGGLVHSESGKTGSIAGVTQASLGGVFGGLTYDGLIDEVRLYDVELSGSDILEDYYAPLAASAYSAWLARYPTLVNTGFHGDDDRDGLPNSLEYLLNRSPVVAQGSSTSQMALNQSTVTASFDRKAGSDHDLWQTLQYSTNLQQWVDVRLFGAPMTNVTVGAESNGIERVTVTFPAQTTSGSGFFVRLKANQK